MAAVSGGWLEDGQVAEEAVDEQAALLGPHRMHGRAGFPAAVLPSVRMGPCISFILIAGGKQPGTGLAELDAESLEPEIQFPAAHAKFLGDLCGRIGTG